MEKGKLLSIVVPIYNAEKYLPHCIESLLKQTYANIEIILVENGSSDESLSICRSYEKKEKTVNAYHLNSAGVSRARNFGVRQAKGSYVMFVDCDDYCDVDYCAKMMEAAESCGVDCMPICKYNRVRGYSAKEITCQEEDTAYFQEIVREDVLKIFKKGMLNMLWNKIYDKAVILENDIQMREDLTLGEDLLFNLEYIDKSKIKKMCIVNKTLYHYVCNGRESLDNRYYENLWELTNLFLDELKHYCILWQIKDDALYADIVYYYYMDLFKNTFSKKNKRTIWEKFKENKQIMGDVRFQDAVNSEYSIKGCIALERWLAQKEYYICFYVLKRLKKFGEYIKRNK